MPTININVNGKIATAEQGCVVDNNLDYTVVFTFSEEWDGMDKTMRVNYGGEHKEVDIVDNMAQLPGIPYGVRIIAIGAYGEDIATTSAAYLPVMPSIKRDEAENEDDPGGGSIPSGGEPGQYVTPNINGALEWRDLPPCGQGILIELVNKATGSTPATVTGLSQGSLYKTGDMFYVECEKACVVGVSFDGEQYMELWAAETDKPNTYAFRLPTLTGSFYVGVALRGNAQGTGQVRPEDATRITRYIANRGVPGTYDTDCELPGIQLLAADADGSGYITAHDSERILRYLAGPTYTTDNTLDWKVWPTGGVPFAAGVTF